MPYMESKPNVTRSNDWPYNLIEAIAIRSEEPLENLNDEGEMALAMCVCHLTEREKKVLMCRYYEQKSLAETGKVFGVTQERIRQVEAKAIRKLRNPNDAGGFILRHGVKAYIDKLVETRVRVALEKRAEELENAYKKKMLELELGKEEAEKIDIGSKILAMTIEELDLSVRAYNCVKRSMCDTVEDLIRRFPTYEDAMNIRNLGRKSLEEISDRLKSLGIIWPIYTDKK